MLAELTARNALSNLKDPRLFREHAYIGGKWTAADDGKVIPVTNPATEAQLGVVPALGAAETEAAIEAAAATAASASAAPSAGTTPRRAPVAGLVTWITLPSAAAVHLPPT